MSPDPCPYFDAIVPSGVLANSPPPYTAPIAVYVAQRTQMSAAVHRPNRAQMGPSGEIARMAAAVWGLPLQGQAVSSNQHMEFEIL